MTTKTKEKPAKRATPKEDIRDGLDLATKGGTVHKPIWTIKGETYKFVAPLNKAGLAADGKKPRLGNRILAKYVASQTAAGADLLFVGMFAKVANPEAN
jgi:hypothetical protein